MTYEIYHAGPDEFRDTTFQDLTVKLDDDINDAIKRFISLMGTTKATNAHVAGGIMSVLSKHMMKAEGAFNLPELPERFISDCRQHWRLWEEQDER